MEPLQRGRQTWRQVAEPVAGEAEGDHSFRAMEGVGGQAGVAQLVVVEVHGPEGSQAPATSLPRAFPPTPIPTPFPRAAFGCACACVHTAAASAWTSPDGASWVSHLIHCQARALPPRTPPGRCGIPSDSQGRGRDLRHIRGVRDLGWARGCYLSAGFSPKVSGKISVTWLAARSATRRERGRNWGATESCGSTATLVPAPCPAAPCCPACPVCPARPGLRGRGRRGRSPCCGPRKCAAAV